MRVARYESITVTNGADYAHLLRMEAIVDRVMTHGQLSRQDDDALWSAMLSDHNVTVEECALFRTLHEKVWEAEIQFGD